MNTPRTTRRRGVVGVVWRDEQFLVIRRSQFVAAPGAYCFPGGGMEAGESEAEALAREIQEELGVAAILGPRLWASQTPWGVDLVWMQIELPAGVPLQLDPREVESYQWLGAEALYSHPELLASNRDFLDAWKQQVFHLDWRPA
ncbi:NUDIX domain-containing protein [Lignipirellula cremea]|uniref:Nudix hydrolase domain-containing protein n=1 Tax=Lignipirellula cremea TaxID=2528010 RepID=A0A518E0G0_9BACT|nr:NUDIX domain-containing protein [Lignipirellula cremea]QDU97578.1 hypothetical protein Pla8534_54280 [Lignipirellula cremea]